MKDQTADGSTVGLTGTGRLTGERSWQHASAPVPVLTILYHPDLRRIGDRAFLSEIPFGRPALVGRYEPDLVPPGRTAGEPLSDIHISRRPLHLLGRDDGGIELQLGDSRTSVVAQGTTVFQSCVFPAADIDRGVVLELSGRVVLLLHRASMVTESPPRFGLVGDSAGLMRVRADVQRVSDLDVPVLLRGETGTGKELVARAIHDAGPRQTGPFVGINVTAIPATLVASELFGAVRGAFTGAVGPQEGFFRRAHGGTLLLDEIGEVPVEVQVALLRALETGEIFPVGSQSPQRVDARVIAATDSDLEAKVRNGGFRAPLFHRLSGFEIWLPPLRERRDDVGRLLIHFLRQELGRINESWRMDPAHPKFDPLWLPPRLVARLVRYDWPGNVRQLRNVARQLVIGSRGLSRLEVGPAVERLLRDETPPPPSRRSAGEATPVPTPPLPAGPERRKPSEVTEEELLAALRANRWDLKATADHLRISRTSLYALIESCPRVRTVADLSPEEIARCHEEHGGDLDAMAERLEVSKRALGRRVREMGLA